MSLIKDLKLDKNGWAKEGTFDSQSIFVGEMNITIFVDDGATEEYAEKCIEHYNKLKNNIEIQEVLQEKLSRFFIYMYDEWNEMGIYEDIIENIKPIMKAYKEGKQLVNYLSDPTMYIYDQQNDEIGYLIECNCPWEPEHQCAIIIRENNILYVGPSGGQSPWDNDFYCIWDDE